MFPVSHDSNQKYPHKQFSRLIAQIHESILMTAALSRLMLAPFVIIEHASRRLEHLALVDGYWRLILALPEM